MDTSKRVPVKTNKKPKSESFKLLAILLLAVFFCWLASWAGVAHMFSEPDDRGLFGDMFGAVNSLFAGLAFAGVIYTIYLQRNELALQRNELQLTRHEVKRTASAQEEHSQLMRQSNEILMATNIISQSMLEEAKRSRESEFAPQVFPEMKDRRAAIIQPHREGETEATWVFVNRGKGAALNIEVEQEWATGGQPKEVALKPDATWNAGWIRHRVPFDKEEKKPLDVTVSYSDVFGNRFEARYRDGHLGFRRVEVKLGP